MSTDLARTILALKSDGASVVYGEATAVNTVALEGAATAVVLPALTPVAAGDYVAVLQQGADRLILGAVSADWTTFTPSWNSGLTLGNGTQTGRYQYRAKTLELYVGVTFGTTTAISGNVQLTLPNSETIAAFVSGNTFLGEASFNDSGVTTYLGSVRGIGSGSVVDVLAHLASGTYVSRSILSSTIPMTWASGDTLAVWAQIPVD